MGGTFYAEDKSLLLKFLDAELNKFPMYKAAVYVNHYDDILGRELRISIIDEDPKFIGGNLLVDMRDTLDNAVVSGGLWIDYRLRNKGLGQALIRAKCAWADELEFNLLMRVPKTSEKGIHILNKYNWQYIGREYWRYYHKTDQ